MIPELKPGQIVCPKCNGRGLWERDHGLIQGTCLECYGRGWIWEPKVEGPNELTEANLIVALEKFRACEAEEDIEAQDKLNEVDLIAAAKKIVDQREPGDDSPIIMKKVQEPEPEPMSCPKCHKAYKLKWALDRHVAKCRK